jgi:small-conductance mechanosensitive channel
MRTINQDTVKSIITGVYLVIIIFILYFSFKEVILRFFPASDQYIAYLYEAAAALSIAIAGYIIIRTALGFIEKQVSPKVGKDRWYLFNFLVSVLLYVVLVVIVLSAIGISPNNIIVGGAFGGVILGLALQSIIPISMSGLMISTPRALSPGDVMILESWIWGVTNPRFCKVKKIGIVFSEFSGSDGTTLKVPNMVLLNSTIYNKLDRKEGYYKHTAQASIKNDVPIDLFEKYLKKDIESIKDDSPPIQFHLIQLGEKISTYSVTFYFKDISEMNARTDKIYKMFDKAYWATLKALRLGKQANL